MENASPSDGGQDELAYSLCSTPLISCLESIYAMCCGQNVVDAGNSNMRDRILLWWSYLDQHFAEFYGKTCQTHSIL